MASYSGDFNRMQEEALARLREMQKRSRTAVNTPPPSPPPSPPPQPHRQGGGQVAQSPPKSLFSDFKIDSERALILLMLFVLYKNKADIKLLLALGYLLM